MRRAEHRSFRRLPGRAAGDTPPALRRERWRGRANLPMAALMSIVVTTYERPDALAAALRALSRQTDRAFEVLVADDGSGPGTAAVIEAARATLGAPLAHVWQEDRGFRVAEARNRALARARGDYVVFLDGDCLARPDFVARHRALSEPGWFVAGNRVLLSERRTATILAANDPAEVWSYRRFAAERLAGGVNRLLPLLALPDGGWRRRAPERWRGARTCNLAAWRGDLDTVDGFDLAYEGWGLEDTDLAVRLMRAGVRAKDGRFATGVLHLWHRENDRSRLAENERRLKEVISSTRVRASRGMSSLAAGGEGA
jgi:glycosyltransferase involved in cell wall biosynthesis